jgi:putative pyruvate formate lyase activating enzyme
VRLRRCLLCPRQCRVDRSVGQLGECRTGARARVASAGPHYGEEAPLVGRGGSGTIFFAGCNLACVFCQNYELSHLCRGREQEPAELARTMMELQEMGCENINLVSPSHVVPQILAALVLAAEQGLRLPVVYNTGGYDSLSTLRLLDGVVDIYMPDMKYSDDRVGERLSGVPDYVERNRAAVREMHRQVGVLELDRRGVARRGLLVRHLVLPDGQAGGEEVFRFIASELSADTYVNVMDQYHPAYGAERYGEISRPPTAIEYRAAVEQARKAGLWRLDGSAT